MFFCPTPLTSGEFRLDLWEGDCANTLSRIEVAPAEETGRTEEKSTVGVPRWWVVSGKGNDEGVLGYERGQCQEGHC